MSLRDLLASYSSLPSQPSALGRGLAGQKRDRDPSDVADGAAVNPDAPDSTADGDAADAAPKRSALEPEDVSPEIVRPTGALARLGQLHGTDKVTHHGYHRFYPRFLEPYRALSEEYGMLEIGVEDCKSLETWKAYFPRLFIYGMDINFAQSEPRAQVFRVDQSRPEQLRRFLEQDLRHKLCFILDDGSHVPEHQLLAFDLLFPALLPGGTYIIEDVETSYWTRGGLYGYSTRYGYQHPRSCVEAFKALADDVNREFLGPAARQAHDTEMHNRLSAATRHMVSSVTFAQNCIVVTKKTDEEARLYGDRAYRFQNHI